MPGAPLLAFTRFHARARLSLASTACSRSSVICFVLFQGSVRAGRRAHLARSGSVDAVEVGNVCSLCLVVQPLGGPTPGHLLRRLLTSAPSRPRVAARRAVRFDGGCCRFFDTQRAARHGAWVLVSRLNRSGFCHHRHAPLAVQISPGKNANCRCTSAAFTVGCVPVGFAVMCQLASPPSALLCGFCPSPRTSCTRASSRQSLAGLPLPSARGYPSLTMSPSRYSHRGLAPHKFAPMLGAHHSVKRTCLRHAA